MRYHDNGTWFDNPDTDNFGTSLIEIFAEQCNRQRYSARYWRQPAPSELLSKNWLAPNLDPGTDFFFFLFFQIEQTGGQQTHD